MKRNKLKRQIEQKFGWDVTGLGTYVDEQSDEIIPALIYNAKTAGLVQVREGIKGSQEIKLIDSSITLQAATSCGRNATGGSVLTDKALAVSPIKVNMNYCSEDLVDTWGQIGLPNGVRNQREALAYEDLIIGHHVAKLAELNEVLIWQGDKGSAIANLNKIDGFAKKFDAGSVTDVNTAGVTAYSASNIIGILQDVRDALPTPVVSGNHKIFVGKEVFDLYLRAVTNSNLFHYDPTNDGNMVTLHGTTTVIERVYGLDGTNKIYAGNTDLMFIGTDLQSDWDDFSIYYSNETDNVYVDVKYRLGVEFVYADQFKRFILAAS